MFSIALSDNPHKLIDHNDLADEICAIRDNRANRSVQDAIAVYGSVDEDSAKLLCD